MFNEKCRLNLTSDLYVAITHLQFNDYQRSYCISQDYIKIVSESFRSVQFLSLADNLLLNTENKESVDIDSLCSCIGFDRNKLTKTFQNLTKFEKIQFQILQGILQNKKYFLLNHCDKILSITEIQKLLYICKLISKKYQVCIILLTEDIQFKEVSFKKDLII